MIPLEGEVHQKSQGAFTHSRESRVLMLLPPASPSSPVPSGAFECSAESAISMPARVGLEREPWLSCSDVSN